MKLFQGLKEVIWEEEKILLRFETLILGELLTKNVKNYSLMKA